VGPLYWEGSPEKPLAYSFSGVKPLDEDAPVSHVSYYEADAYAHWRSLRDGGKSGTRLPTEAEWETAAREHGPAFHWGELWEWTGSAYLPYPGYAAPEGALGEYNGKFMCNQMVLRGASHGTPASHRRVSYRNFFGPGARWQFTGIRLARRTP
jgi:formylglycine-generating enzyme required for sulfatase activity